MFSDIVSSELKSLRSYAQLLLGSAEFGDQVVCEVLGGLIESVTSADMGGMDRACLFHQLDQKLYPIAQAGAEGRSVHPILQELPISDRRVLLLSIVGRFETADVARITGLHLSEVAEIVERVEPVIIAASRTGVLIIEDEPHMAELLSVLVEQTGHWVAGIARNAGEAMKLTNERSIGLILSDIDLGEDVCGRVVVRNIREALGYEVPTIFITAHPERLGDVTCADSDGVVPKPFDIWRVREAVNRAVHTRAEIFA
jgi:CheY-like chemotaxis protein